MIHAKNVTHEGVDHVYYHSRESATPKKAPERVTMMDVRHHSRQWIASLLGDWEETAASDIQVVTMNGNAALGFQWLGTRPLE